MANMVEVMERGLNAVYDHLKEIGKHPTGAPYAAYISCNEDFSEFDLELGFPVAEDVSVKDSLYMSKTYKGRVVATTHKGSYKTLETAYHAAMKYVEDNKLELVGIFYDYYLNDPSTVSEDEILTKVVIPVK